MNPPFEIALREMIERHEGKRKKRYRCPAGKATIGIGWNIDTWSLPPDIAACERVTGEITDEMIDRLYDTSIGVAIDGCEEIFKEFPTFSDNRRMALVDMAFNLGAFGLMRFKAMRRAIAKGDWNEAAEQVRDSEYWRQLGAILRGPMTGGRRGRRRFLDF